MEYNVTPTWVSNGVYGDLILAASELTVLQVMMLQLTIFFRAASGTSVPDYVEVLLGDEDIDMTDGHLWVKSLVDNFSR